MKGIKAIDLNYYFLYCCILYIYGGTDSKIILIHCLSNVTHLTRLLLVVLILPGGSNDGFSVSLHTAVLCFFSNLHCTQSRQLSHIYTDRNNVFFVTDNLPFLGTLPNNKRVKFRTYLNVPFFNKEKFGFFSDTYLPLGSKSLSLLFFLEVVPYIIICCLLCTFKS